MELIESNITDKGNSTAYAQSDAYIRAKQKVANLKGFYIHLFVYIMANTFITWQQVSEHIGNGKTLEQTFQDEGTYMLWIVWGFGVVLHGLNVFITNGVFGQKWEERKINKYMEEAKSRARN